MEIKKLEMGKIKEHRES